MSDLQSKTPIIDAFVDRSFKDRVDEMAKLYELATALELAANGLAEHLNMLVNEKVDYMRRNNLGDPDIQFTVVWAREALAAFTALQPSPHDAPRTETHQVNE